MNTQAVTTVIPYRHDHVLWSLVEVNGRMWVITEIDPVTTTTRLERAERDGGMHIDAGYYLETSRMPKVAWAPGMIAAAGVFLFLALVQGAGAKVHTSMIVGLVFGFWFVVWLLSRHEQRRRGRHYGRWYV